MIPFGGEQRGQSFVERVGFSCETSSGGEHEGGEGSMFDFSNSLLICTLFDALVLSVASGRLGMSVRWGMGVKNPDVKVRSFKSASPDTVCCYVQPCSILMVYLQFITPRRVCASGGIPVARGCNYLPIISGYAHVRLL